MILSDFLVYPHDNETWDETGWYCEYDNDSQYWYKEEEMMWDNKWYY